MKSVILVTGPTASGKSDLAISIAKSFNGEIVNIDSVQVFRDLNIASAKTIGAAQEGIPHHMIDVKWPNESIDAAWFIKEALACIKEIQSRGKLCVLCGGASMYITLLFHGLAKLPGGDALLREKFKAMSLEDLQAELKEKDPETASRLHPNDRIRIERALEACQLSGSKVSELQAAHAFAKTELRGIFLVLCWPRDLLYERINARSKRMFSSGLIEETQKLVEKYGDTLPCLKSIGYAQALKVIKGLLPIDQALAELQQATRNYAKRQYSFWRNEPLKRGWTVRPSPEEEALEIKSKDAFYLTHKRTNDLRAYDYALEDLFRQLKLRLDAVFESNELFYLNARRLVL